jgi:hypothetical protein
MRIWTQALGDLGTHALNGFIKGVNVGELFTQKHAMVRLELSLECLGEQIAFGAHATPCKLGQDGRIGFPSEQGSEHVARRPAHYITGNRSQFDVGILQRLAVGG